MPPVAPTDDTTDDGPDAGLTTHLNPAPWARGGAHDQGQLRSRVTSILTIGGQRPVDGRGRLLHEGDLAAQVALALDNLTDVVVAGGMTLADLACLRIYTTDIAALRDVELVVGEHLAEAGATPPVTVVEVSSLAVAGMDVEIDGLAVGAVGGPSPSERNSAR